MFKSFRIPCNPRAEGVHRTLCNPRAEGVLRHRHEKFVIHPDNADAKNPNASGNIVYVSGD